MPINKQVYDLVGLLSPYFARTGGAGTGGGAGLDWAPATTTAGVDKDGAEDNGGAGWTRMAGHTYLWAPLKITEILWDISVVGTYAMYISSGPSAVVQRTVVAAQVVAAPGTEVSFVPDAGVLCLDAGEYWLTVEISAGTCAWDVYHGDAENVLYYAFDSYMDAVVKPDWVAPFKLVAHIGTWLGTVTPGTTLAHGDLTGVTPAQHHAAVTLGGGSDPALALAGQELTLADVLTPAEHTAIGDAAPHHAPVTLGADAGAVLGLTGQQIDLDVQNENTVLAGPAAAPAADPTFRALVPADVGTGIPTGALFLRDDMSWQAPGGAIGDHDHSGDAGDGGTFDAANLTAGASDDGDVLTSDGLGGAAWEPAAGAGDVATDAIWDALGDLAVGTGANTAARLAVGADDLVLTADSGEATGLKWAAAPSAYTQGCRAYNTADQSIPKTTWTSLAFNTEEWDTDGIHDNVTNNTRLTCKTAGKYAVWAIATIGASTAGSRQIRLLVNGATESGEFSITPAITYAGIMITGVVNFAVNDYVEVEVYQSTAGALTVYGSWGTYRSYAGMQRVG